MSHWLIMPILLPAVVASLLVLAVRHDIVLARVFSVGSTIGSLLVGLLLFAAACDGKTRVYALGNWHPPFGIVLVLDRLAATMLLLTAILGLIVALFAINGWDQRGRHFHPLMQFQLMGLNGAFLTGDLFNLFVFYEVLLIASYGLMVHGGGAARMRAGVQYVVINLTGSCLFLVSIALIYGVSGTLNLADLSRKVPNVPAGSHAMLNVGAMMLLVVFALKSAVFPIHLWLPGTYTNAPGPVAALFSIMTKVGAYSMLRVFTLVFPGLEWILPAALATLAVGSIGILSARSLGQQASFAAVASMGTILIAFAGSSPTSQSAGLFYLPHSTLSVAGLFLIVDLVINYRSGYGDALVGSPKYLHQGMIASMFLVFAISISGLPPLSGFIGKLLIMRGAQELSTWGWIWFVMLVSSLIGLVGFSKSGSLLFWKCGSQFDSDEAPVPGLLPSTKGTLNLPSIVLPMVALGIVLALLVTLSAFAGPITRYMDATAAQLHDPEQYNAAVLGVGS